MLSSNNMRVSSRLHYKKHQPKTIWPSLHSLYKISNKKSRSSEMVIRGKWMTTRIKSGKKEIKRKMISLSPIKESRSQRRHSDYLKKLKTNWFKILYWQKAFLKEESGVTNSTSRKNCCLTSSQSSARSWFWTRSRNTKWCSSNKVVLGAEIWAWAVRQAFSKTRCSKWRLRPKWV